MLYEFMEMLDKRTGNYTEHIFPTHQYSVMDNHILQLISRRQRHLRRFGCVAANVMKHAFHVFNLTRQQNHL